MKNYSLYTKLSIIITFIATVLLLFLFFQNSHLTPLILHFIYNFGDFVGNKYNLIYITITMWFILGLNIFLAAQLKINFKPLYDFILIINFIISTFFLIWSLQIFLNNI